MARTRGIQAAPKKETFVRTIEYNNAHVGKTTSGTIYAVFDLDEANERRTLASDIADAKSIIDSAEQESHATDSPRCRGRRTKGVKMKLFDAENFRHLSHGGYRMCPPADCTHKCHWEGEPEQLFWVDSILCASICKKHEHCEHFKAFMKESKKRIKLQNTERIDKECQFCKALIKELNNEDGSGVYHCGTSYNRLEGEYTRVCKPPKKKQDTQPKRRRTK